MKTKKPSFAKWILTNKAKAATLLVFLLFSLLGRLYFYTSLAGSPCDDGFLCRFWRYIGDINWGMAIFYEFITIVPVSLVLLSYWGLYKQAFYLKPTK